ncbi:hypothetical protein HanPSC8_Chr08g0309021 [Helianthus annuus]|nr:hypothetical protein HanPSC8_Chr08g0309021 [Helianthus annuus]
MPFSLISSMVFLHPSAFSLRCCAHPGLAFSELSLLPIRQYSLF